jgi:imidazolonepropionase-like amidohydrolase
MPSGPPAPTYSGEAIEAMVAAVHAAGGRVAAHVQTDLIAPLVRAGVDSIEHGTAMDEPALQLTYQHDPREDLTALSSPAAVIINGIRVR